jgi:hypothetical protein
MMTIAFQLWTGCSNPDPIIPDLAPLDDNQASLPTGGAGDPYPEELAIVSGGDSDLWFAHGAGYLHASVLDAWTAALDPDVGVDRRKVAEWSVEQNPQPDVDASYIVHQTVHDVITVDYDLWWRHEVQAGTVEEPEQVVAVWSKIAGTPFIDILQYSLVITPVEGEDEIVALDLIGQLKAAADDDSSLVSFFGDFHASLAAVVHGEPLPTY